MSKLWDWLYRVFISDKRLHDGAGLFDEYSKQGQELMSVMRFSVRLEVYCALLMIACLLSQIWWVLPWLAFMIAMCEIGRGFILNKAQSGYPYPEPTDMIGIAIAVVFFGAIALIWFIGALLA
ncbi:hypothetical protein IMCC3088_1854 [Aequoribacter fuscus]|uniref:Uncharacterized protein n=1 Tax=Aequoribacter fuscus TaxID=2518989 RepID=F3L2T0_9GAMM|nr:hypothetical protein [Aequoribacter fuscus]EGG29398.1 hypothetical protein IMCC3088_1854 [Aequoribacter fuscus]QHJ87565.1 hypothetical protein EYZ66_04265 [Aequoribacter fuscus]